MYATVKGNKTFEEFSIKLFFLNIFRASFRFNEDTRNVFDSNVRYLGRHTAIDFPVNRNFDSKIRQQMYIPALWAQLFDQWLHVEEAVRAWLIISWKVCVLCGTPLAG